MTMLTGPVLHQHSLFAGGEPSCDRSFATLNRTWLDATTWLDHAPGWMGGAEAVFEQLVTLLPWRQREVTMYQRRLPEPRLTAWWEHGADHPEPLPVLAQARRVLTNRYEKPFDTIGFNLYRDGSDSVAWHADRERFEHEDPVVVIVSTGSPRPFRVRRTGGGPSHSWSVGDGDLLVMGGACQHDFQHCVPKVAAPTGARLSIMFRHHLAGFGN
jgi:alkylated DNA repair dioxygenase AlkB